MLRIMAALVVTGLSLGITISVVHMLDELEAMNSAQVSPMTPLRTAAYDDHPARAASVTATVDFESDGKLKITADQELRLSPSDPLGTVRSSDHVAGVSVFSHMIDPRRWSPAS